MSGLRGIQIVGKALFKGRSVKGLKKRLTFDFCDVRKNLLLPSEKEHNLTGKVTERTIQNFLCYRWKILLLDIQNS